MRNVLKSKQKIVDTIARRQVGRKMSMIDTKRSLSETSLQH